MTSKLYFAAPESFEKIDFDKIGSGQGVARNGYGIYMGEFHLAKHYLDSYEHYSKTTNTYITKNGRIIPNNTKVGQIIEEIESKYRLEHNSSPNPSWVIDQIEEELNSDSISPLEIKAYRGVMYEVDVSAISTCESGDIVTDDDMFSIIDEYYNRTPSGNRILEELNKMTSISSHDEDVDFELVMEAETPSEAIDDISSQLYEYLMSAYDEDMIDLDNYYEIDDENVKKYIYKKLCDDYYSFNEIDASIEKALEPEFLEKLNSIKSEHFKLEFSDLTVQSCYDLLCSAIESEGLKPSVAGDIFTAATGKEGYYCENNMAEEKSFELVVFNKEKAEALNIKPICAIDSSFEDSLHYRGIEL